MVTVKQQFIHFLKQNNIYEEFIWNLSKIKNVKIALYEDINPLRYFMNNKLLKEYTTKWDKILTIRRRKLFLQFLNRNNIKQQFKQILLKEKGLTLQKYLNSKTCSFTALAFYWHTTKEGYEFWHNVSSEEVNYIMQQEKPTSTW